MESKGSAQQKTQSAGWGEGPQGGEGSQSAGWGDSIQHGKGMTGTYQKEYVPEHLECIRNSN